MKNTIYITIVTLFLYTSVLAQYSNIKRTILTTDEVPKEVQLSHQRQFNDGFVTGWKLHKRNVERPGDVEHYMAAFKKQGRLGNYAYYTQTGELLAYSLFVDGKDLPGNIREYCLRNFNTSSVKSAELIDLENPQRFIYRVRLNAGGSLNYLYFDSNGNKIDKFKLPAEIFVFI
jgi:hypothetical protein